MGFWALSMFLRRGILWSLSNPNAFRPSSHKGKRGTGIPQATSVTNFISDLLSWLQDTLHHAAERTPYLKAARDYFAKACQEDESELTVRDPRSRI